jgi:hypothetical protein
MIFRRSRASRANNLWKIVLVLAKRFANDITVLPARGYRSIYRREKHLMFTYD